MKNLLIPICILLICLSFTSADVSDISTLSNIDEVHQTHIKLDLTIDFTGSKFAGSAIISFISLIDNLKTITLDNKALKIIKITDSQGDLVYTVDESKKVEGLGVPLVITLRTALKKDETVDITIQYETTKDSLAIQWMTAEMTSGAYPFVYSQCEAANCRSLLPCQDSPATKITTEVNLTVKKPMRAVYSGILTGTKEKGDSVTYSYKQEVPVPSYLIAIAAGELFYAPLGERTGVWAEQKVIDNAKKEFEDTETFISTIEGYLTKYEWTKYDILVLPKGFPFGGMENPNLTFVTPSLIAGDKSLANVIAHEIAHSWTGNLVSNKNWQNFWLNEGFTVFLERKCAEILYGEDMANLQARVGFADLKNAVASYGENHSYTSLYPDLKQNNPDDAFSTVPYEKGYTFLKFLEKIVGKENFQKILQKYIETYKFKSIDYIDFKNLFEEQVQKLLTPEEQTNVFELVDWDTWIKSPGMPYIKFAYNSKLFDEAKAEYDTIISKGAEAVTAEFVEKFKAWHTNVKLAFLNLLDENFSKIDNDLYNALRDNVKLHSDYNAEVKNIWYGIALKLKKEDIIDPLTEFLTAFGRLKYIRPLFKLFFKMTRQKAVALFEKNKPIYHPMAVEQIQKDFDSMQLKLIE